MSTTRRSQVPPPPVEPSAVIIRALRELLASGPSVQVAMGRQLGIPPGDVVAVDQVVSAADPIGPAELGRRLGITSASATAMVDRLEASGHLSRAPHPQDRRRVTLQASGAGREQIRSALTPLVRALSDVVDRLDPDQTVVVQDFLAEATEAIRAYADPSRRRAGAAGSAET